jgi:glycosyltransferase involved in cell wall biosynthesis
MNYPLAIFAPFIGARSETFIRRHMQDLLPGGTVVVTRTIEGPCTGHWNVNCPLLVLKQADGAGLKGQALRAMIQKLGWRLEDHLVTTVRQFLKKHGVQVVIGEYLDLSLPWFKATQELGIRFFAHAHGYDVSERLREPRWQAEYLRYNRAAGLITVSQLSRARLVALGLDPMKIHVVPCGVDVPDNYLERAEHEIVRCLAVGRMVAKKAPILTLDAFRRAVEVFPNLRLDYVGTDELFPAAQQFVRAFNLGTTVTLHGGQPSAIVHQLMREADIFLQHSITDPLTGDEEGLPVSILEAMAHGLPVLTTRHGGIPEAVLDGTTGYLVAEGDSSAMAERLAILARNPSLRRQMGYAAWRRAKDDYAWEKERLDLLKLIGLPYQTHTATAIQLAAISSLA